MARIGTSPLRRVGTSALRSVAVRTLCTGANAADESARAASARVWGEIKGEALEQLASESCFSRFGMDAYLSASVLEHDTLLDGLATEIGGKLRANEVDGHVDYNGLLAAAMERDPSIVAATAADMERFKVVDPACDGLLGVFLFYKGVQALACARVAHHYWTERGGHGKLVARLLQSSMADVYGVDIHPGCD